MPDTNSGKIIVRKGTIVRCEWCGSPESYDWYTSESGQKYCSSGCLAAGSEARTYKVGLVSVCCSLILLFPAIGLYLIAQENYFSVNLLGIIFYAFIIFLVVGIGSLIRSLDARKYLSRKGMYSNISTSSLECGYCNHLNPPDVLICQNCSAPLTNALFSQNTIPPWILDHRLLGRFACPFCQCIYTYYGSMMNDEGQLKCQNCGRPFPVPGEDLGPPERGKL